MATCLRRLRGGPAVAQLSVSAPGWSPKGSWLTLRRRYLEARPSFLTALEQTGAFVGVDGASTASPRPVPFAPLGVQDEELLFPKSWLLVKDDNDVGSLLSCCADGGWYTIQSILRDWLSQVSSPARGLEEEWIEPGSYGFVRFSAPLLSYRSFLRLYCPTLGIPSSGDVLLACFGASCGLAWDVVAAECCFILAGMWEQCVGHPGLLACAMDHASAIADPQTRAATVCGH